MSKPTPHDSLFVATFSKKREVVALLKTFFLVWAKALDFRTLKLETDTYVNQGLDKFFSDMVYSCQIKGSARKIKITLLLEHKSFVPKVIYVQLLKYITGIYDLQLQNNEALSLVVPIVIYHGRNTWQKRTFAKYFDLPGELNLERFVPSFDYELIDLNTIAHSQLLTFSIGYYARASFTVMKSHNKEELAEHFTREALIFAEKEVDPETKKDFLVKLLTYIFKAFSISQQEVEVLTKNVLNMEETVVGNLYDKLIEEGIEKGIEKGMEKERMIKDLEEKIVHLSNPAASTVAVATLADLFGLSQAFVEEFYAATNKQKAASFLHKIREARNIGQVEEVAPYLMRQMFDFGFSVNVIAGYFGREVIEIQKITGQR